MFLYSTRVETWKPIGFLRVSGGGTRVKFPSILEPFYFTGKIRGGISNPWRLTVPPPPAPQYIIISSS